MDLLKQFLFLFCVLRFFDQGNMFKHRQIHLLKKMKTVRNIEICF